MKERREKKEKGLRRLYGSEKEVRQGKPGNVWEVLRMIVVACKLLNGVKCVYVNSLSCVRLKSSESEFF